MKWVIGAILVTAASLAAESRIYVMSSGQLDTLGMDGKLLGSMPLPQCLHCGGLGVDGEGRAYITSPAIGGVVWFGLPGSKGSITPLNSPFGAFGITLSMGKMYVLGLDLQGTGTITAFNSGGSPAGPPIQTAARSPHFTVDPKGKVYVTSSDPNMMQAYGLDGRPTEPRITGLLQPRAVAVGPDGKIFVADQGSVLTFLPDGRPTQPTIILEAPKPWKAAPLALTVDSAGKIYVAYNAGVGVQGLLGVYNPDGRLAQPVVQILSGAIGIAVH